METGYCGVTVAPVAVGIDEDVSAENQKYIAAIEIRGESIFI